MGGRALIRSRGVCMKSACGDGIPDVVCGFYRGAQSTHIWVHNRSMFGAPRREGVSQPYSSSLPLAGVGEASLAVVSTHGLR